MCPLGAAAILLTSVSASATNRDSAERYLRRELRLAPLGASTVWLVQDEHELRERLAELPRQRERMRNVQRQLDEQRRNNQAQWNALAQTRAAIKRASENLNSGDPAMQRLKRQLESLEKAAVDPREFGGHENAQPLLVELTTLRNEILLSAIFIRRTAGTLPGRYEELAQDPDAVAALAALGPENRLGPARDYAAEVARLAEFEEAVAQSPPPVYLQSGHVRLAGVVNETAPVTFTWRDSSGPVLLTTNAAQACGFSDAIPNPKSPIPRAAPETITFNRRRLAVTRAIIPYIQFGGVRLSEVEAFILPPEAEDLGSHLGSDAFRSSGYSAVPRAEELLLDIEKR